VLRLQETSILFFLISLKIHCYGLNFKSDLIRNVQLSMTVLVMVMLKIKVIMKCEPPRDLRLYTDCQ
jgi:hypothetical protein